MSASFRPQRTEGAVQNTVVGHWLDHFQVLFRSIGCERVVVSYDGSASKGRTYLGEFGESPKREGDIVVGSRGLIVPEMRHGQGKR